jgi:hypothetical protein
MLANDETVNAGAVGVLNAMAGIQIEEERGVVSFIFEKLTSEITIAKMKCSIQSKGSNDTIFGRQNT